MSDFPTHVYQFEYANNASSSHQAQAVDSRPYLPQDDHIRPAFFSYSPDVVKHRKRTSRAQRKVLEEAFRQNPKPSSYTRKLLIHQTGMDRRSLQVWFQNRRAKEKKVVAKATNSLECQQIDPTCQESPVSSGDKGEFNDSPVTPTESPSSSLKESPENQCPAQISISPSIMTPDREVVTISSLPSIKTANPALNSKRSYDSTPGDSLCPPALRTDFFPSVRRGSAPAPLGLPIPHVVAIGPESPALGRAGSSTTIQSFTSPTHLQSDDIHSARRGSLPACYLPGNFGKAATSHLPPIPSDPNIRRASLERSLHRLSSHPFAWQVASSHGSLSKPFSAEQAPVYAGPSAATRSNEQQQQFENIVIGQSQSQQSQSFVPVQNYYDNHSWGGSSVSHPRSYYQFNQQGVDNHSQISEIVPGPLPQPGYSFGTAPAPIPEDDSNISQQEEQEDRHYPRDNPYLPRFSSFASTDSTVSSALYSDGHKSDTIIEDGYHAPGWQSDRRASCPAPFMSSFAGLEVSSREEGGVVSRNATTLAAFPTVSQLSIVNGRNEFDANTYAVQGELAFPAEGKPFPANSNFPSLGNDDDSRMFRGSPLEESNHTNGVSYSRY